jgi:hypothetical protein
MQNGLKSKAGCRIGKNAFGQVTATQAPIVSDDVGAKHSPDFLECRLARLDNLSRQFVGINHWKPASKQQVA